MLTYKRYTRFPKGMNRTVKKAEEMNENGQKPIKMGRAPNAPIKYVFC